jgi:hypothetical protein
MLTFAFGQIAQVGLLNSPRSNKVTATILSHAEAKHRADR